MSLRAIILGLLLIPVNCYWTTIAEVGFSIGDCSTLPLFAFPIATIFSTVTKGIRTAKNESTTVFSDLNSFYPNICPGR